MSALAPLGGEYCNYFYYLMVLNFIILLYILLSGLFIFLFEKKRENLFQVILVALPTFVGYFTTRLLYSMCVGSTQM
jgi:hypothetical protein